ncbi:hypothetical protein DLREEDagrD3_08390 [Denitratisoma sp. agr-D3]
MLMENFVCDDTPLAHTWMAAELRVNPVRVLQTLVNNLDGMIFRCMLDEHWTMLFVSSGCQQLTGYAPEALLLNRELSYESMTHPDDRANVRQRVMAALAANRRFRVEYRIIRADGSVCWVAERGAQVVDENGNTVLEGFVEDITEQVQAQHDLASAEARYRSIFENSSEGIFQTTADGHYLNANPALARIYGYDNATELIAALQNIGSQLYVDASSRRRFQQIMADKGYVQGFEAQVRRLDGTVIWISENARAVHDHDGEFLYYEGTVQDITETKRYQAQLEHQASHDLLTGLPNRTLFADRLKQSIRLAERNSYLAAVAFIDLDNFKYINDSLGHKAGDDLLVEIANRLRCALRGSDTVARYGGDEFVLILNNLYQVHYVVKVINRVLEEIQRPMVLEGQELCVTCSIGLSLYPSDGDDPESLIQHADAAMYLAKESGRNNYKFFTRRLNELAVERVSLEGSLRRALEREELNVFFQPKVDTNGYPVGMEALLRWFSPEHGVVSPDRFIGLAEDTGLIEPITEFVLRTASRQAVIWREAGYPAMQIAVNLSARSLKQEDLADRIMAILAETGLPPEQLELELTESMLIEDIDHSINVLQSLKAKGIRLAIDDFGTGYSSLSYLQRFPVDILKIDRTFVRNLELHPSETDITKLIILLGHSLKLRVVAEGVETENQWEHLDALGCDEFQGFLFAKPMAPADLERMFLSRFR